MIKIIIKKSNGTAHHIQINPFDFDRNILSLSEENYIIIRSNLINR